MRSLFMCVGCSTMRLVPSAFANATYLLTSARKLSRTIDASVSLLVFHLLLNTCRTTQKDVGGRAGHREGGLGREVIGI